MMRCFTVLLYASAALAAPPVSAPQAAGMSAERLNRLAAAMRGYVERGDVAGTVTLVARRGKVVHLES